MEQKITKTKLRDNESNYGFCYTAFPRSGAKPFSYGRNSFFIHREGVVAIHYSPHKTFWNEEGEILLDFVKDKIMYRTCLEYAKGERSLALRINNFVKECINLN